MKTTDKMKRAEMCCHLLLSKKQRKEILYQSISAEHYEGYISCLSVRKMYDKYGNEYYCVDESLRSRLEAKLIKTTWDLNWYVKSNLNQLL